MARATTGQPVPAAYKPAAGSLVHYAFAGTLGAIYGAATAQDRSVAAGVGLPFGAAVWIAADELGMPILGLAKPPNRLSLKITRTTFASHLVFGSRPMSSGGSSSPAVAPRRRAYRRG